MNLLGRLLSSIMLGIFSFFLLSMNLTASTLERGDIFLVSYGLGDTCSWNIQCEKVQDEIYACHSTNAAISTSATVVQNITVGKCGGINIPNKERERFPELIHSHKNLEITYVGPDTFVYPFVSIIKIQV